MVYRVADLLEKVRENTWVPPVGLALLAVALAATTLWIDHAFISPREAAASFWLFSGRPADALNLLNTVAVSVISVAGIVFSVTIVALQLASSQFTPRILQTFTEFRVTQVVLGTFIGTFAYSLLVQWSVRTPGPGQPPVVPSLSVTTAVVLAIFCMLLLIYFIDSLVHFIRGSRIVQRLAEQALEIADHPFPTRIGRPAPDQSLGEIEESETPSHAIRVGEDDAGFLQAVDTRVLFGLEETDTELVVEMAVEIGQYLLPGEVLARIRGAAEPTAEQVEQVKRAFVTGSDRTPDHDVDWTLIEMKDLALKALSPAIQDPTTAIICINSIGKVLVRLGQKPKPPRVRTGKKGLLKVITRPLPYERAVEDAVGPLRAAAAESPAVAIALLEVVGRTGAAVRPEYREPLSNQVEKIVEAAREILQERGEMPAIEAAGAAALRRIEAGTQLSSESA